jgi:hypothetical protein
MTSMGQQFKRDTLNRITWASILIFAGLVFLAQNAGYLPNIPNTGVWNWIMLGAGGLLVLEAIIRALSPNQAEPHWFGLIGGIILIGIGASPIFRLNLSQNWWSMAWPVVLIVMGIGALARGLRQ